MIQKAQHNWFLYPFFTRYSQWLISKHFHAVNCNEFTVNEFSSVLVLANHMTWWDGFWIQYLNTTRLHKKFFVMMLYEQLQKFRFFNYCGGFSVAKGSRSVIESISYAASVLENPNHMLLMFPQGVIESLYTSSFSFEGGVEKVLKNVSKPVQVLFVANFVDYLSHKKPSLYMNVQEYRGADFSAEALNRAYTDFYQLSLSVQQMKRE
jgi:hypothetical protein